MRVRKYHQNSKKSPQEQTIAQKKPDNEQPAAPANAKSPAILPLAASQKTKLQTPAALFRKIMRSPNLNTQLLVIILTLASDNFPMERGIDSMSSTVDKIRNITDVINSTMESVKVAANAPKQIRRLMETHNP